MNHFVLAFSLWAPRQLQEGHISAYVWACVQLKWVHWRQYGNEPCCNPSDGLSSLRCGEEWTVELGLREEP